VDYTARFFVTFPAGAGYGSADDSRRSVSVSIPVDSGISEVLEAIKTLLIGFGFSSSVVANGMREYGEELQQEVLDCAKYVPQDCCNVEPRFPD
jgi:hypothetical protein